MFKCALDLGHLAARFKNSGFISFFGIIVGNSALFRRFTVLDAQWHGIIDESFRGFLQFAILLGYFESLPVQLIYSL